MLKHVCEFCYGRLNSPHVSVCGPCDEAMERQYRAEDAARAKAHAAKYKCQRCGTGLPLARRLTCMTCVAVPPGDDIVWDMTTPWGGDDEEAREARATFKPIAPVKEKPCSMCKVVKPAASFVMNRRNRDGLHNSCKECKRAQGRAAYQRKKEAYAVQ